MARRRKRANPPWRILRTDTAASYLGLAPGTLKKRRLRGQGPCFVRLGGRAIGYDVRDLDAWIDEQRASTDNDSAA